MEPAQAIDQSAVPPSTPAAEPMPPRPVPNPELVAWTTSWWEQTESVPDYDVACRATKACVQTLFPAWWDSKDPWKGRQPRELKKREDSFTVNTPFAYLNTMQTVAQSVPEDHQARWIPIARANDDQLGGDEQVRKFGRSMASVTKSYLQEIGIQEKLEAWVQEASFFPLSVMKVTFEREMAKDSISEAREQDEQDNHARIQQLVEDLARGAIVASDPRVVELQKLMEGLGGKSELEVREGLNAEVLPLAAFRIAPGVVALEQVYLAPWMSHDVEMEKKRIRQLFPFVPAADGTWTGVHPEDLDQAKPVANRAKAMREMRERGVSGDKRRKAGEDKAKREQDDKVRLLVREVWDRESNRVNVFVEGIEYPAASYVPERTPSQWYPFVILVLNRLSGQVYGVSDVELQAEDQHRINRKRSDEEMARYNGMPRGFYDSNIVDEKDARAMGKTKPFSWTPLPMGGKGDQGMAQKTVIMEWKYNPALFDTSVDQQNLQRAATLPEQSLGVNGTAHFAEEVKVGAQGSAIATQFRNKRIRRALERFYDVCGQILLQELSAEAAKAADETVVWPVIYGDAEGRAALEKIRQEVRSQVLPAIIQQARPMDPATGMPIAGAPPIDPHQLQQQVDEASAPLIAARCEQAFGFPEPITREVLYRRLRVSVSVALDGLMDRDQRVSMVLKTFEAMATAAQASMQAGVRMNMMPFLRPMARLIGADDDLVEEMFSTDPNQAAQSLVQALSGGDATLDGALAQQLVAILQQMAAAGALSPPPAPAPPGPGGRPTPAGPPPGAAGPPPPAAGPPPGQAAAA